jgi:hypothetical protein
MTQRNNIVVGAMTAASANGRKWIADEVDVERMPSMGRFQTGLRHA